MDGLLGILGCGQQRGSENCTPSQESKRLTLLCAAMDCTSGPCAGGSSSKKSQLVRKPVPFHERPPHAVQASPNQSWGTPTKPEGPGGIGVVFKAGPIGSGPLVKGVVPGGSADKTGVIQTGDELLEVTGENISALPAAELAGRLIGPVGSKIDLKFRRKDGDGEVTTFEVSIERQRRKSSLV